MQSTKEKILEQLTTEYKTTNEIAKEIGVTDPTVRVYCNQLLKDGIVIKAYKKTRHNHYSSNISNKIVLWKLKTGGKHD